MYAFFYAYRDDFNPRSPRGCDEVYRRASEYIIISIHAAQEGCDSRLMYRKNSSKFQSTQPKRAATCHVDCYNNITCHFNPRSPRGLRLFMRGPRLIQTAFQSTQPKRAATKRVPGWAATEVTISIHAAQEGCDYWLGNASNEKNDFNPRSPRGLRRTRTPISAN